MKLRSLLSFVVACAPGLTQVASAADNKPAAPAAVSLRSPKAIAVVDTNRLMMDYPGNREMEQRMDAMVRQKQAEEAAIIQEGQKLMQEIDEISARANDPALTDEKRKELQVKLPAEISQREEKLRQKQGEHQQFIQRASMELNQGRQGLQSEVEAQIQKVTTDLAKKLGYDLVIGRGVLYCDPSFDITEKVSQAVKADYARTHPEGAAAPVPAPITGTPAAVPAQPAK